MGLNEYREKRNFSKTSEPKGTQGKRGGEPIFVIQEHHASRLHYDLRLEHDGVLKSWAVTKEPSLDPAEKRLAVEVEDHPVTYARFTGNIPEGEYGAGEVEIWDNGTWQVIDGGHVPKNPEKAIDEGLKSGHLTFWLDGDRLKGGFALVRMDSPPGKKPNWLLVKMKDRHADRNGEAATRSDGKSRKWRRPKNEPVASVMIDRKGKVPRELEFTSTDRVMFPEVGLTKGDLLDYYDRIADRLLPHLCNRPMTLERLPEGLAGEKAAHFWQKNTPDYYPDWIPRVTLETTDGKDVDYVLVNDRPTLLWLVNQGTITFHPWMSRIEDLNRPDYVLFDLDPGEREFSDVVAVARSLHDRLEAGDCRSWVKTSGKSGLHVLVSWRGRSGKKRGDYDAARIWAMEVASAVAGELPEVATTERSIEEREGRLYIDVLQNIRGHHAVPPYVVRATAEATVSTPLRWEELSPSLDPTKYTVKSIFRRLGQLDEDLVEGLATGESGR